MKRVLAIAVGVFLGLVLYRVVVPPISASLRESQRQSDLREASQHMREYDMRSLEYYRRSVDKLLRPGMDYDDLISVRTSLEMSKSIINRHPHDDRLASQREWLDNSFSLLIQYEQ